VNAEFYRFYELQPIQNRLYFLRVTLYTKATPGNYKVRGKELFRSLNSLRNFISQANRAGATPFILRQTEDNTGEVLTSLKQTGFELIPENDEGSVVDDDLSDALNPDQPVESVKQPVVAQKEEVKVGGSGPDFGPDGKPVVYRGEELVAKIGPF